MNQELARSFLPKIPAWSEVVKGDKASYAKDALYFYRKTLKSPKQQKTTGNSTVLFSVTFKLSFKTKRFQGPYELRGHNIAGNGAKERQVDYKPVGY